MSSIKERVGLALENARLRHHRAENPFVVLRGYTRSIDDVLEELFASILGDDAGKVALVAVGGYGREELCPYSDLDLLFLREKGPGIEGVAKLVRRLWDSGFHLGQSVRTPEECYGWMVDDIGTAAALLEARFLCGNTDLFQRFLGSALWRFRRRRQRSFVTQQLNLLGESLADPGRSIYMIEPLLKEGICGLRDIQRVLWIENVRRRGSTFEALARSDAFSPERVLALEEAYGFYLRVRSELHCVNGVRLDVLDRDSQEAVASNLGYGDGLKPRAKVEMLMGDYYRHARSAFRFLRYYLETETRGRHFFARLGQRFLIDKVTPHLHVYKRLLYLSSPPPEGGSPEEILDIFRVAQTNEVRLSESLCEWIRQRIEGTRGDYTHSSQVMRKFVAILRDGRDVGALLKAMRETGVLKRVLPEFAKLDCLVSFDGHHHFTVDAHTLRALGELDRIATEDDYREPVFQQVYKEIGDPLPLRVALLLHDIGKAFEGDHSVSGSELALLICDRLGIDEKVAETVEFLVYRHLELFNVSVRYDVNEQVIESLARVVRSEERLKMLYLLTYIDVTSVGPGTWTGWKGAQLSEVYRKTLIHLRSGQLPTKSLEDALAGSDLEAAQMGRIIAHCHQIDTPGYHREILPVRMLSHVDMVDALRATRKLQISTHSFGDYHEITFCAFDRSRLFMDLTGLLFSEGFNVLGARIFSRRDGFAIDQFFVEIADRVRLDVAKRIERIQAKVDDIRDRKLVIADIIRQRTLSYRAKDWHKPLYGPRVVINNEASKHYTLVEVNAGDRPGLLFELAMTFHHLGLDVVMAKVSTFGERVRDTFYVLEEGGKVDNPARRLEIEHAVVKQAGAPGPILRGGI